MKNIFIILLLAISVVGKSQVIIGDDIGTAADKRSVLLEFANTNDRGIILPYVSILPSGTNVQGGTFVLDISTPTQSKVKMYDGSSWIDLSSGNAADVSTYASQQSSLVENNNAKVIIGANASTAEGILVLESSNKAMVLPMVSSTNMVMSPAPGTMVYINNPGAKRLAVFNGNGWTFWEPGP